MKIAPARELIVRRKAYPLAMPIFEISKRFPKQEQYSLTSQIRRSSRSVCLNLREAWAKRRRPAHFIGKLTDCGGENAETETSFGFARDCLHITDEEHCELAQLRNEIEKTLGLIIRSFQNFTFCPENSDVSG